MNIAFVNAARKWGGVKTWTLDVAQGLRDLGDRPLIAGRPGPFVDRAARLGLDAVPCSFGFDGNPLAVIRFMRLFQKRDIEIVVVNIGKDMRTAGLAARLLGLPVVHRVGLPGDMRPSAKVVLAHRFVRPRMLVPCEFIKQGLLAELPFLRPEEVTVIRTGKRPAAQAPTGTGAPRRLIMTSQLNPDKGHAEVLDALAALRAQGLDFRLSVAGAGRDEAALKEKAAALGLTDRVDWLGFVADAPARLRDHDVFVLASHSEGLPNALLEAMAQGLAPAARDVGGVAEIWPAALDDLLCGGRTGRPLQDVLARALTLSDADLLARKQAAWTACRERFDLDAQVRHLRDWLTTDARQEPRVRREAA